MKTLNEYEQLTIKWAKEGIIQNSTASVQTLKLVSEVGELADNVNKGRDIRDNIGDCMVCLANIAAIKGLNLTQCWNVAYTDIKDRRGYLNEDGCFIKEDDVR